MPEEISSFLVEDEALNRLRRQVKSLKERYPPRRESIPPRLRLVAVDGEIISAGTNEVGDG